MKTAAVVLLLCIAVSCLAETSDFGDAIDWVESYEQGMHAVLCCYAAGVRQARESDKPGVVIIHKSWCGACKNLKVIWVYAHGMF